MTQTTITEQVIEEQMREFEENFNYFDAYGIYGKGTAEARISDLNDIKSFLTTAFAKVAESAREEAIAIIKEWKNDGDTPTETDLVLENILKRLEARITNNK